MSLQADLGGKVVVVTGASSGIGRHFCGVLAANGATVLGAARRSERLDELAGEVPGVVTQVCDVSNADDCARLMEAAVDLGGPHVLVNAAGFGDAQAARQTTSDDLRRTLEVNLVSVFTLAVAASKVMKEGGSIINVGSIFGLGASWPVTQAAYCAAKGGVVNLTRQLGAEWARDGIRVNAIAPGWFPSEQTEAMFQDERAVAWVKRNTPLGRPGRLNELDGILLLLASDASTFITGQVLAVDGGWTAA